MDIKSLESIWRVRQLNATINTHSPFDLINSVTKVYVVYIHNGLRLPPVGADVSLISSRPIRARALTLLRFCVKVWLGLRIVNISDTEANPTHTDDCVLLELEALCFEGVLWVLTDHVP